MRGALPTPSHHPHPSPPRPPSQIFLKCRDCIFKKFFFLFIQREMNLQGIFRQRLCKAELGKQLNTHTCFQKVTIHVSATFGRKVFLLLSRHHIHPCPGSLQIFLCEFRQQNLSESPNRIMIRPIPPPAPTNL